MFNNLKINFFILNLSLFVSVLGSKSSLNYNLPDLKSYKSAFVLPKVCLINKKDCYYLIGRKAAKKHKGQWTLIGGKREETDLSLIDTLKREFKEETLGAFDMKFIDKSLKLNFKNSFYKSQLCTTKLSTSGLYNSNLSISKDLKAVLIAQIGQKELFDSAKKFYKRVNKLKLENKADQIELDKLALIKKPITKNIKAFIIEPRGQLKLESITLRSNATKLLK